MFNPTLYDKQAEFVNSDKLFNLFLGAINTGKSYAMVCKIIRYLVEYKGIEILVTAKTQQTLDGGIMSKFRSMIDDKWITRENKNLNIIYFSNGSILRYSTFATATTAKAYTVQALFIDELATISRDIFMSLRDRVREADVSMRGEETYPLTINCASNTDYMLAGTTNEDDVNIVQAYFLNQGSHKMPDEIYDKNFCVIKASTYDNPFLTDKTKLAADILYYQDEDRHKVTIMGEDDYEKYRVFQVGVDDITICDDVLSFDDINFNKYLAFCAGVDFGGRDPYATVLMGFIEVDGVLETHVLSEFKEKLNVVNRLFDVLYSWQTHEVMGKKWMTSVCDTNAKGLFYGFMENGLHVSEARKVGPNNEGKEAMVNILARDVNKKESRSIYLYKHLTGKLQEEMMVYRWNQKKNVSDRTSRGKDHLLDAFRYAYCNVREWGDIYNTINRLYDNSITGSDSVFKGSRKDEMVYLGRL